MKRILTVLMFASSILATTVVFADEKNVATNFNCNLYFTGSGVSAAALVGFYSIHGTGFVKCFNSAAGKIEELPIIIEGRGPSFGIKASGFNISGKLIGVSVKDPALLLGQYKGVRGSASIILGAGVTMALQSTKENFRVTTSFNGEAGIGLGMDDLILEVKEDPKHAAYAEQMTPEKSIATDGSSAAMAPQVYVVNEGQPVLIKGADGEVKQIIYLKSGDAKSGEKR